MRLAVALLALLLAGAALPPSGGTPEKRLTTPDQAPVGRAAELDQLFDTLKTTTSADAARAAERGIIGIWLDSGSPSVDLLMGWAMRAMAGKDYAAALDFLDRVVTMKPDYVEGWNKRATVYFLIDDYGKSIADIERVLALEPRHFGALAGLGSILRDLGEDEKALAVYRRILEIDPHMDDVQTAIDKLTKEGAEGQSL